ncbi:MAG: hypothetical protein KC423_20405 [Anaerolineales bacterium]|nr:hypothetical protein [Anaerolineales bacterium]
MSTIRIQTQLPFKDLLNSLHQLSAEELTQLTERAAKIKMQSQQRLLQEQLLLQMQEQITYDWSETQQGTYQHLIEAVKNFSPEKPRQLGLLTGLVKIRDDFDDPLPETVEALFWGNDTDDFGLSIEQA